MVAISKQRQDVQGWGLWGRDVWIGVVTAQWGLQGWAHTPLHSSIISEAGAGAGAWAPPATTRGLSWAISQGLYYTYQALLISVLAQYV